MRQAAPVLSWRRLGGRTSATALALAACGAAAEMVATVVTGRVAEGPTSGLVTVLAVLLVGSAVLDTAARTVSSGVVGRAEGRLRADLLGAARRYRQDRLPWSCATCSSATTAASRCGR